MEAVNQNYCDLNLELQLHDFSDFPEGGIDIPGLYKEEARVGDMLKSGNPRAKNAVSYVKSYKDGRYFGDSIADFLELLIEGKVELLISQINPKNKFIRMHIPIEKDDFNRDFDIDNGVLVKIAKLGLALDFWFLR